MRKKILIVDDDEIFLIQLQEALKTMGVDIHTARDGVEALQKLEEFNFDVVLADSKMPLMNGLELLENIKELYPYIFVVIMTAYGDIPMAVKAMKLGAYDFIQKPFDITILQLLLEKVFKNQDLMKENIYLHKEVEEKYDFHQIVGKSEKMKKVYRLISLATEVDSTVLITGETGVGKELVAKAIHYHGRRKNKPLVTVDCSAIPETLLDSELFGHEKGAFTGAYTQRIGKLELAHEGTIFLDEIGDFPLSLQGKLLRFLQEREICRVGGNKTIKLDVGVMATTNRNLEQLVREKKFREDLYFRINVLPIHIPPLRERLEDIPLLVNHFLKKYCGLFQKMIKGVSQSALSSLYYYDWPGNVRELEHVIERAVVMNQGETIEKFDIPSSTEEKTPPPDSLLSSGPLETDLTFKELKDRFIQKFEKDFLMNLLSRHKGNITQAARKAGLNYKTFYEKIVKYGIDPRNFK